MGVLGLLTAALVGWGCSKVLDVEGRIVRLETQMITVQKSLDRIEDNTAPRNDPAALAGSHH